ncbi:hypothetical protein AAE478_005183 [Parahypoxylon ruwenzoriense]
MVYKHKGKSTLEAGREELMRVKCSLPIGSTQSLSTGCWDPEDTEARPIDAYEAMITYLDKLDKSVEGPHPWVFEERSIESTSFGPSANIAMEFAEMFLPAGAVVCETRAGWVGIVPQKIQKWC